MKMTNRDIIRQYFTENPESLKGNYGKTARELNVPYNAVQFVATEIKRIDLEENIVLENNTSKNTTSTNSGDYDDVETLPSKSIESLKSYCASYGIPYDYVTSAKFINHNFQEVWNVVCDMTQMSEQYVDTYFEKLKTLLTEKIKPYHLELKDDHNNAAYHNYIADAHVGASPKKNDVYENEYDADIFEQRVMSTLENYVEEANLRGTFEKFVHVDLGDSVNSYIGKTSRGLTSHSNNTLHENMDSSEVYDTYVRVMRKYFDKVVELDLASEIEFIAISNDNHGSHFSYIVNRAIEDYLNIKYPEIKTTVERSFISHYDYGIHHFMFTHGKDEVEMFKGFPLNLDEKVLSWLYQYMRKKKIHAENIHLIKGDLHQENQNISGCIRYRNILSLYGSNSWSMLNFGHTPSGFGYEIVYKERKKINSGYLTFN